MAIYLYGTLFTIGLVLTFFAYSQYQKTVKLQDIGRKTTAHVIRLITVQGDDGNTYKPVFEYLDRSKNTKTFVSDVSSSPPSYKIGDKVKIVYNPKEESDVKVISYWGLYRWTIILIAIASPLLIIGGGYLLYVR